MKILTDSAYREIEREIDTLRADVENVNQEIVTARRIFRILRYAAQSGKLDEEQIKQRLAGYEVVMDRLADISQNTYGMCSR